MSVKPIIPAIEDNSKNKQSILPQSSVPYVQSMPKTSPMASDSVSFQGANPIVGTMDFIEAGGYAASFIIQDGLGFIAPRVGKGLLRGSKQTDENGQPILDENGKQKRELNWALARKEFLREIITGPSAFLIPLAMFAGIKKWFGSANNVKLNFISGFEQPFMEYAKANSEAIKSGENISKKEFYKKVYTEAIERSVNAHLPEAEKMSAEDIAKEAEKLTKRHLDIDDIDPKLKKKQRAAEIEKLGGSVEDMFMHLKKNKIGGAVNEMLVEFNTSKGVKGGSIDQFVSAMGDYFDDAVKTTRKALNSNLTVESIEDFVKRFTNTKMGSRILTNLGIFGTVALFYTQIPKLYNMGIKGNPALKGTAAAQTKEDNSKKQTVQKDVAGKQVPFTGLGSFLEKAGKVTFESPKLKKLSDIFEFDGNIMSGAAMPVLLYGFCIPPRLEQANDKYDYGEIVFRDMTSFTALLFGAKALARLFSDIVTKYTGLALNKKDMENRNVFQKIIDYLNPLDTRHSVLSSKQLVSKYTNIDQYKGGINGFVQFIEESNGNIKKVFAQDNKLKSIVEEILQNNGIGSYKNATEAQIKEALEKANDAEDKALINKLYDYFKSDNKILRRAKTWNSTFGFVSTILLIPGLIIWIGQKCEKMTAKKARQDKEAADAVKAQQAKEYLARHNFEGHIPSMAGFLGNSVR